MKLNRLTVVLVGIALLWLASVVTAGTVTVSNLMVAQRPGTKLVDINYDLSVAAWTNARIGLVVSNAGVQVSTPSLTGDLGLVTPGVGKAIIWDMGADWNGNLAMLSFGLKSSSPMPVGGDPSATNWVEVNDDMVRNYYSNSAVTMQDRIFNIMWIYHATTNGKRSWSNAVARCNGLDYAGYSDWVLPSRSMLQIVYDYKQYFTGMPVFSYDDYWGSLFWSSTTQSDYPADAWGVSMLTNEGQFRNKSSAYYVWPCRTGAVPAHVTNSYNLAVTMDSRDYELVVYTDRGVPAPSIGTNLYVLGSTVTCAVSSEAVVSNINWRATGWTGTGSIPTSGATNTTGPVVLTDPVSSITWNWTPSFSITNLSATQRPGTKLVDITYDIYSDITNGVPISLIIEDGGTSVPTNGIAGSYGVHVLPGVGKSIVWNAGANWNGKAAELVFRISHSTLTQLVVSGEYPVDTRSLSLTVASMRGSPSPPVGTASNYIWGSTVTCSVPPVVVSGVNWRATGWTGTGSVPSSGTTNTTGPIMLTNMASTITWNWETAFSITNVTAVQRPGTKVVDITYDLVSDVTNTAPIALSISNEGVPVSTNGITGAYGPSVAPGPGKVIVWNAGTLWNGNEADLNFAVSHRTTTQLVGSCTGAVDTRSYSLTVSSVRGSPSPAAGTNSSYSWSATVTATVRNVAGYTMTGWTGTGSVPATGSTTNTGPIVLTDLVSSIIWNWTTNDYTVTFDAQGGTATDPASNVVTFATAYGELPTTEREYYHFAGWWTGPSTGPQVFTNTTLSIASNHTLYARWTIYTYPVTLHPGLYGRIVEANSNQSYVASVDHGAALPTVTVVPHAGYSFTGWSPAVPGAIATNFEATAQYTAISPPTYDVGVGSITIANSGNYIITGTTASNTIAVETGIQANITLINVSVVLSNGCAFHINGGASVSLTLLGTGTNRFTSCADHAGIHLAADSSLAIASNSTATLIAQGGSGGAGIGGGLIGTSGTIAIRGGTVQATGGLNAAGMGGGSGGSCNAVVVEGTAKVVATGGDYGPGIGSGFGGATNLVTIGGSAVVQARGGSAGGAGIGGGQSGGGGTILIGENASVTATGGLYSAGIGGGSGGGGGNISISSSAVVTGTGGDYGAGIGGGLSGTGGTVLIADSSTVTATGATGAAGIGGGFGGAGGTIDIYALATIRAGADLGSAVVVVAYGGEFYVHIAHLAPPGLAIMSATGSNFVFSAATNGYSGYAVEGADCALLPGGAWGWELITNYTANPDGSISVPLENGGRRVIRLKLTP